MSRPGRLNSAKPAEPQAVASLSPPNQARAKSVSNKRPLVTNTNARSKANSIAKPKSRGEEVAVTPVSRSSSVSAVHPFVNRLPPRPVAGDSNSAKIGDAKDISKTFEFQENLIKDLQAQVLDLKLELHKAHTLNQQLKLELSSKVLQTQESTNDNQSHNFKDIQKLIANKLENSTAKKDVISVITPGPPPPPMPMHLLSKVERNSPSCSLPPPPPPPPPMRPVSRALSAPKTPAIVEFYHSLRKQEEKKDVQGHGNQYKATAKEAHNSIVGEIQNRSAHLLAIKSDVETKGDFINGLIKKVLALAYTDIEDVMNFVDWLDGELSKLADERAVLKHFSWPERKADAIREAAIEYRELKRLENELSSFKDDASIPCGTALKKMAVLLDKSEQGIERLIKLRNSALRSYQDWKIPTNWMLDSGMMSKIKQGSMQLAKMYMRRVLKEVELGRKSENQEALVLQGVDFAYRAHQFAGGLDSETMCAFQKISGHLGPGSRAAVASS
ncbi:protein CHUP1, chloroplastic [Mercurialis annua]|uniref:protein CHUP1, chloroplastic n=1 Tax=Mercurialis annua TaxID=3986 RepID=UPI002160ED2B|nr:protein CHUP1, chloroplastic [Mercurialis annua]